VTPDAARGWRESDRARKTPHRVRNAVDVFSADEQVGRLAGALLGKTGGTSTVDALVAAEALTARADVLTADAEDLRALLAGHPEVGVIAL